MEMHTFSMCVCKLLTSSVPEQIHVHMNAINLNESKITVKSVINYPTHIWHNKDSDVKAQELCWLLKKEYYTPIIFTISFWKPFNIYLINNSNLNLCKTGKLAIFKAKVIGNPTPTVTWRRAKGQMNDPEKFQNKFDPTTSEHTLEVCTGFYPYF